MNSTVRDPAGRDRLRERETERGRDRRDTLKARQVYFYSTVHTGGDSKCYKGRKIHTISKSIIFIEIKEDIKKIEYLKYN